MGIRAWRTIQVDETGHPEKAPKRVLFLLKECILTWREFGSANSGLIQIKKTVAVIVLSLTSQTIERQWTRHRKWLEVRMDIFPPEVSSLI
jgi:hypothetical protein